MYRFFGLTAVNYTYLGIHPKVFGSCLKNYRDDKKAILLMKEQFIKMKEFLETDDLMFIDRVLNKKLIIQRSRLQVKVEDGIATEQDLEELERIKQEIESQPKFVNDVINKVKLSPLSKRIIEVLYAKKDSLDAYISKLEWKEVDKVTERFFGKEIYQLKKYPIGTLFYFLKEHAKYINDTDKLNASIEEMFRSVSSRFVDSDYEVSTTSVNITNEFIKNEFTNLVDSITLDTYKSIAGPDFEDCTIDDFHNSSVELRNAGLIGFTPFMSDLYKNFLNTYVPSFETDVKVYKGSDLGVFAVILKRGADSFGTLGEEL